MKDAKFNLTLALPAANANNNTGNNFLDTDGNFDDTFRRVYYEIDVPALSDHTNNSVNVLFTLQSSTDGVNFANTNPLIQCSIPGVASTGTAATVFRVPLPPRIAPWVRFNQLVPINGPSGNAVVNYDLIVP